MKPNVHYRLHNSPPLARTLRPIQATLHDIFFPLNQQSYYKVIYELMCWLSGSLNCRLPNVMRSPPARRSLVSSVTVDWCLVPRRWGFYLKSKSTNYPDHGHHGDPPPTRKIPIVEPKIEPGTSWLVVRSSDHYTTRLVLIFLKNNFNIALPSTFRSSNWYLILRPNIYYSTLLT